MKISQLTAPLGLLSLALVASAASVHALDEGQADAASANPIRKVMTMLQMVQKTVAAEGAK